MEQQDLEVRTLFDGWALDGRADKMEESHKYAVREGLRDVSLPQNAMILDLGCGNGYVTRALAKRLEAGIVMGIDISSEMVHLARDITPESFTNTIFFEGSIFDSALDEERFDLIFCMESLYYMRPMAKTLERVYELLSPGGQFIAIVDYYQENTASLDWPEKCGVEMELLSAEGYLELLSSAKLEDIFQQFIRYPEEGGWDDWKVEQGSLLTSGFKPFAIDTSSGESSFAASEGEAPEADE